MEELTHVDIEGKKVAEYSKTEAALAVLREKYAEVPDVHTKDGYEEVKKGLSELTGYRTGLEKMRKAIKEPYLIKGRLIDSEAKRITEELLAIEVPLKTAKDEADKAEARAKAERIAKLQAKVDAITAHIGAAHRKPSSEIAAIIEAVDAIDPLVDFYDLTQEAVRARNDALRELGVLYADRLGFERAELEREEADKARAEAEDRERVSARINLIKVMPVEGMGNKDTGFIQGLIDRLKSMELDPELFGDRLGEAKEAHRDAEEQLQGLLAMRKAYEDSKAMQEEAEKKKAAEAAEAEEKQKVAEEPGEVTEVITKDHSAYIAGMSKIVEDFGEAASSAVLGRKGRAVIIDDPVRWNAENALAYIAECAGVASDDYYGMVTWADQHRGK